MRKCKPGRGGVPQSCWCASWTVLIADSIGSVTEETHWTRRWHRRPCRKFLRSGGRHVRRCRQHRQQSLFNSSTPKDEPSSFSSMRTVDLLEVRSLPRRQSPRSNAKSSSPAARSPAVTCDSNGNAAGVLVNATARSVEHRTKQMFLRRPFDGHDLFNGRRTEPRKLGDGDHPQRPN